MLSLLVLFCSIHFDYFNINRIKEIDSKFLVIEDFNNYVFLENDNNKFIYYDNNTLSKGNNVTIKGKVELLDKSNEFNKYLNTQKVNYIVKGEVIDNDYHLTISKRLINRFLKNKDEKLSSYLRLVLFNDKNNDNSYFYQIFNKYSLTFLIVISGFHINLLFKLLKKTGPFKYLISLFYLFLLDLSISSLKAFLYLTLKRVNKRLKLYLNNCDLLVMIFIVFLFINPSNLFNLGFIYTFLFSFSIDLINNAIYKNTLFYKFIKKNLIFLVGLPLILNNSYSINTFSYLLVMTFTFFSSVLFVLSLLYLIFDPLKLILKLYIDFLLYAFKIIDKFSYELVFGKPNSIIILVLYLLIILFIYLYENNYFKRAYFCVYLYVSVLLFQYSLPYLDNREIVYFIDVGQGDCMGLKIRNSKKIVLIDTGGNKNIDIAKSKVIPFLKKEGINCIDLVIISHDDFDHRGALTSLMENFNVNRVIDNSLFKSVKIGDKEFINLNITDKRDNNGSNVLYGNYGGINYLFTGDIDSKIENKIVRENKNLKVDILKVSHHGSKSSSSEEFISTLLPKVGVIEVGRHNRYGHPNKEVIDRLNKYKVKVYKTSSNGNLKIYKNRFTNLIVIEKQKDML